MLREAQLSSMDHFIWIKLKQMKWITQSANILTNSFHLPTLPKNMVQFFALFSAFWTVYIMKGKFNHFQDYFKFSFLPTFPRCYIQQMNQLFSLSQSKATVLPYLGCGGWVTFPDSIFLKPVFTRRSLELLW